MKIAVVGVTGMVGQVMLRILEELNAGRSDAFGELRTDMAELTAALKELTRVAG